MEMVCGDSAMNDPWRRGQCTSMAGLIVDTKAKSVQDQAALEPMLSVMCKGIWTNMTEVEAAAAPHGAVHAPSVTAVEHDAPAVTTGLQAAAQDDADGPSRAAESQTASAAQVVPAEAMKVQDA